MSTQVAICGLVVFVAIYAAFVVALVFAGRRSDARALARFIPDCLVLVKRLLQDQRVPRSGKVVLAVVLLYLASPIDLVPDFIPVAGQLDDAIVLAIALRFLIRRTDDSVVRELWPGPRESFVIVSKIAGLPTA